MNPILIALIGMAVVVGGVLAFRLHAFLALVLGAFSVMILTSADQVLRYSTSTYAIPVETVFGNTLTLPKKPIGGNSYVLRANPNQTFEEIAEVQITGVAAGETPSTFLATLTSSEPISDVAPGDLIIHATQLATAKAEANKNWGQRIGDGLGGTLTKIALLIAMASIIGKCLLDSGGAERIVGSIAGAVGEKRMPIAFIGSGFTLGIPVFFDTVFYLMMPLGKALRVKTGKNYLLYVLTIIAGGTMAHSLVPPTPGPLFVAAELGIDIGLMMIGGLAVGLFTASAGYLWAIYANRRWEIPLRPSEELPEAEIEAIAKRDPAMLPGLWFSILPILLPVLLMGGATAISMMAKGSQNPDGALASLNQLFSILGNKNIAMTLAAISALILLIRSKASKDRSLRDIIQSALASGGVIILITAAGGAFGHTLRQTGIAFEIKDLMPQVQSALIPLGFFICMLIRTAQGSSTVAMITAVGIVVPIISAQDMSYHPIYIALAIGCGSKPISWMNDSAFWVISKMSGLTEREMLKTNTIMGLIMGFTGLAVCMLGATLLPMV